MSLDNNLGHIDEDSRLHFTPPSTMGDALALSTIPIILASFAFYLFTIFACIVVIVAYPLIKNGLEHPRHDIYLQFSIKFASWAHAIVMSTLGCIITFWEDWGTRHVVYGRSNLAQFGIAWEIGYLLHDTLIMVISKVLFNRWPGVSFIVHHVLLLVALPWYFTYMYGDFFFGVFFCMTLSSAFWHSKYLLGKLGWERTWLYYFARTGFPISFIACRFLSIPYMFWQYSRHYSFQWYEVPFNVPKVCTTALSVVSLFNCYWFAGIVRTMKFFKKAKMM